MGGPVFRRFSVGRRPPRQRSPFRLRAGREITPGTECRTDRLFAQFRHLARDQTLDAHRCAHDLADIGIEGIGHVRRFMVLPMPGGGHVMDEAAGIQRRLPIALGRSPGIRGEREIPDKPTLPGHAQAVPSRIQGQDREFAFTRQDVLPDPAQVFIRRQGGKSRNDTPLLTEQITKTGRAFHGREVKGRRIDELFRVDIPIGRPLPDGMRILGLRPARQDRLGRAAERQQKNERSQDPFHLPLILTQQTRSKISARSCTGRSA